MTLRRALWPVPHNQKGPVNYEKIRFDLIFTLHNLWLCSARVYKE